MELTAAGYSVCYGYNDFAGTDTACRSTYGPTSFYFYGSPTYSPIKNRFTQLSYPVRTEAGLLLTSNVDAFFDGTTALQNPVLYYNGDVHTGMNNDGTVLNDCATGFATSGRGYTTSATWKVFTPAGGVGDTYGAKMCVVIVT